MDLSSVWQRAGRQTVGRGGETETEKLKLRWRDYLSSWLNEELSEFRLSYNRSSSKYYDFVI